MSATGHTLDHFISSVLIEGVHKMTYGAGLGYLAVGTISVGIEFLGACCDAHDFIVERESKNRFNLGIKEFMGQVNPNYLAYNDSGSPYFLYRQLRCGMAHIVRPQGKVAFTGRGDARKDGLKHLEVCVEVDKLVIVVEDFCDDFIAACELLRKLAPSLPHEKLRGVFLPVHEIKAITPIA